jgi:hypothetical protein
LYFSYLSLSSWNAFIPSLSFSFSITIYSFNSSVSSRLSAMEIYAMRILREFKIKSLADSFCCLGLCECSMGLSRTDWLLLVRDITETYSETGTMAVSWPMRAICSCLSMVESCTSKMLSFCLFPFSLSSALSCKASC